ncbi:MAG: stage V sporulation protein AB [Defluviitaleaceae bacterium]|nr:stage V sporulation protein AB [Defluviitaleaceae bacterium]
MGYVASVVLGLASGMAISGAVFAFIAAIGVVPRMAKRTNTQKHIMIYEEAIIWGGIFGAATMVFNLFLPLHTVIIIILSLCTGIFFGVLAMCLAETLDVLPIFSKRASVKNGISYFVAAIALGKMTGSLLYFIISGFFKEGGQ